MNSNKQQVPEGTLIDGRYRIVRLIGQGGMALVYLAVDEQKDLSVAMKIMKDDLTSDQEFVKRFEHEARAASSLDHPNIVKVLGYGQDGDYRYIVQEYVEGCTLKDMIRQNGVLEWQQAVPLVIQIGLALEHAHRRGVVHRDIKPHNILITRDMVAKVTDFGIARAVNTNTITLTSQVTYGSVHYFSPEQARGGLVSEKSDLYSLGILLYEMLTGQVPFNGDTSVAVAIKHLQEMPPLPSTLQPGIPAGLDNIILKCIQKTPENRYMDVRELVDELDAFMVDPDGLYGVLTNKLDNESNTTAIGLKRPNPNYGKLRDIEKTINDRRKSRRRDLLIMITIIILSLVFLVSVGMWGWQKIREGLQTQTDRLYTISNYVGREVDDVVAELKEAGVSYKLSYRQDNTVDEGIIIDQNPMAGISIKPDGGTVIYLYVSGGQEVLIIPDYSGQTEKKAKTELEQTYGFVVTVTTEYANFDKGIVIKTIPAAGEGLPRGGSITLVVSDGMPTVKMINIVGTPYIEARSALLQLNLIMSTGNNIHRDPLTGEIVDVPEEERVIIIQSVEPDTELQVQTIINVTYGTAEDYANFLNPTPTPLPSPTPTIPPTPTPTETTTETTAPTPTTTVETTASTSILPLTGTARNRL